MAYTVTNNPWSSQYAVGIGTDDPKSELNIIGKLRINSLVSIKCARFLVWKLII